jgi:hypothetical protein
MIRKRHGSLKLSKKEVTNISQILSTPRVKIWKSSGRPGLTPSFTIFGPFASRSPRPATAHVRAVPFSKAPTARLESPPTAALNSPVSTASALASAQASVRTASAAPAGSLWYAAQP